MCHVARDWEAPCSGAFASRARHLFCASGIAAIQRMIDGFGAIAILVQLKPFASLTIDAPNGREVCAITPQDSLCPQQALKLLHLI